MPELAYINQRTQLAAESVAGTAVAATKRLNCFDFVFGALPAVSAYRPSGTKYDAAQEEDTELSNITVGGILDYNGLPYLLSGVMGIVAPVNHSPSTTAKDWIYVPPVSGSVACQTYSFENGDAVRARKFCYGTLSDFGYKGTRVAPFMISAKGFGQPLADGISMTASPTDIALAQVTEPQFNIYLDTTSAGLGTTLLTRCFSVDYSFGGIQAPFWALARATVGFTGIVDASPKTTIKILLAADSTGFAAMLGYMQTGQTVYLQVDAQGATIDTPNSIKNEFKHQLAIKVGKPTDFKEEQKIFATEWECTVVQDPLWVTNSLPTAQKITVTNLITAL
jgi:hypothetical protein